MDSDAYARLIEGLMSRFGDLSRICAVTSDSASAWVNAKRSIMNAYPFVFSVPDQAHLADLPMKDIGKMPWVKQMLDKVAFIAKETRGKRKLLTRFKDSVEAYNSNIPDEAGQDAHAQVGPDGFPVIKPTAFMLLKASLTRLASHEGILEAFLRTRGLLTTIVATKESFATCYGVFAPKPSVLHVRRHMSMSLNRVTFTCGS